MQLRSIRVFVCLLLAVPVHASDHQVSPSDSWATIQSAFAACASGDRVVFSPGTYALHPPAAPALISFAIQGTQAAPKSNIEVVGNQAILMLYDFNISDENTYMNSLGGLFNFNQVQGVSIHDLTIDMVRAPYSCGEVRWISSDGRKVQVEFYSEFLPVSAQIRVDAFLGYSPAVGGGTPLPNGDGCDYFENCAGVGRVTGKPSWLEFDFSLQPTGYQVPAVSMNDPITVTHKKYGFNALMFTDCSAVEVKNVTVKRIPGMAVIAAGCDGVSVDSFQVPKDSNPHHLMSTSADGLHFMACKGYVRISGNTSLARMGDDGVNIGNNYLGFTQVDPVGSTRIKVNEVVSIWFTKFEVGDFIEFYKNQVIPPLELNPNLLPVARAKILAYEHPTETEHYLTLDVIPSGVTPGMLLSNVSRMPQVEIRDISVSENRARGVLLTSQGIVLENGTFRDCTGPGVLIQSDKNFFFEGPGARDVRIKNCLLERVNNGATHDRAAITVVADVPFGEHEPLAGVHASVWIEGSDIRTTERSGIYVGSTRQALILKNKVTDVCLTQPPEQPSHGYALYLRNVDGPVIAGGQMFGLTGEPLGFDGVTPVGAPYIYFY